MAMDQFQTGRWTGSDQQRGRGRRFFRGRRFQKKMRPSERARQYTVNRQPKVHRTQSADEQRTSLDQGRAGGNIIKKRLQKRRGGAGEQFTTNA